MGGVDILDLLWGMLVNIPVNNPLGLIYVVLNAIMLIMATIFGFGGEV